MRRLFKVGVAVTLLAGLSSCGSTQDHVLGGPPARPVAARTQPVVDLSQTVPDYTGHKVPVDTYATNVCMGLDQFGLDYAAARTVRSNALDGAPAAVQTALLGYYDALDRAFDRMSNTVRASGIPELAHGDAMAAGVVTTLGEARKAGDSYRPQTQALPLKEPTRFHGVARRIVRNSDHDVETAMRRLGRYDADPNFRKAFDRSKACPHQ